MKMLELQQDLNRISGLIRDISDITDKMALDDFIKNLEVKERTYFMLQELGDYANEALSYSEGNALDNNLLSVLKSLERARYNLQIEINDQTVFYIIKKDLPNIQQIISKTILELQSESSMS